MKRAPLSRISFDAPAQSPGLKPGVVQCRGRGPFDPTEATDTVVLFTTGGALKDLDRVEPPSADR